MFLQKNYWKLHKSIKMLENWFVCEFWRFVDIVCVSAKRLRVRMLDSFQSKRGVWFAQYMPCNIVGIC